MTEVAHTAWYRLGTVSVTNNSTTVTGDGTYFTTAGIYPGATFRLDVKPDYAGEVREVISDTEIELVKPWLGSTETNQDYSINRNFQSTVPSRLAADVASLVTKYERYIDTDMETITGKSAYEIACDNNFSGTEAQWLASLVGGTEDTVYRAKLDRLLYHNAGSHNSIYRGKDLGTFNTSISSAIQSGAFYGTYSGDVVDVYVGDYFEFSDLAYSYTDENSTTQNSTYSGIIRIADLDYFYNSGNSSSKISAHHAVAIPDAPMFNAAMNATNTTAGGYVSSKMRTVYLKRAEAIFKAAFGASHILSYNEYLSNAVTDGKVSGKTWTSCSVELMNECQLYGHYVYRSDFYNNMEDSSRYEIGVKQFNLFRHRPDLVSLGQYYWLRDVVSAASFADVSGNGLASYNSASNVSGVRPAALIY